VPPAAPPGRASPAAAPPGRPTASPLDEAGLRSARARLIRALRDTLKARHYSHRTEKAYVGWVGRFFCSLPRDLQPQDADVAQAQRFLAGLATQGRVAAPLQEAAIQAREAGEGLLFFRPGP
jgi:hypothetical protein